MSRQGVTSPRATPLSAKRLRVVLRKCILLCRRYSPPCPSGVRLIQTLPPKTRSKISDHQDSMNIIALMYDSTVSRWYSERCYQKSLRLLTATQLLFFVPRYLIHSITHHQNALPRSSLFFSFPLNDFRQIRNVSMVAIIWHQGISNISI